MPKKGLKIDVNNKHSRLAVKMCAFYACNDELMTLFGGCKIGVYKKEELKKMNEVQLTWLVEPYLRKDKK